MAENWIFEQRDLKYYISEHALCSKCKSMVDYKNILSDNPKYRHAVNPYDSEYHLLPKYNFCPHCRDGKSDIKPSDKPSSILWKLADNGWVDCSCAACGYTENIDFPGNWGYKFCPSCGVAF